MKLSLLFLVSGALLAAPIDYRLDNAARRLTLSSSELVRSIQNAEGESHVAEDAETLQYAAEHFQEEVELGPEDLDIDFQTITQSFDEARREIAFSEIVRCNATVRDAWFATEESFTQLRQAWLDHGGGGSQCDIACRMVTEIYQVALGRNPDPGGLNAWKNVYYSQGLNAVIVGVFSSDEDFLRHGRNNYGFVVGLYNELLQRSPDPGGLNGWVGALNAGSLNRAQVVNGFVTSPEYRSRPRF